MEILSQSTGTTYRISVGVNPRVNAFMPSVLQVVLTQSNVDLYFCPVAGENPSVCIRDLIISIGYMTAQSYDSSKSKKIESKNQGSGNEIETRSSYRISGRGAEQNRFGRVHLVPSDSLLRHLPLHQFFIGPEISSISAGFTAKSRDLSFVNPGDPVGSVNLFNGIPRTGVKSDFIRLGLQTCVKGGRRVNRGCGARWKWRSLRSSLNKRTYGYVCVRPDQTRPNLLDQQRRRKQSIGTQSKDRHRRQKRCSGRKIIASNIPEQRIGSKRTSRSRAMASEFPAKKITSETL